MKQYAIDTHPLVWYLLGQMKKLGGKTKRILRLVENGKAQLLVPAPVTMELLYLVQFKGLKLDYENFIFQIETSDNFGFIPVDASVMRSALVVPMYAEVFDRWIVAAAKSRGLALITKDELIRESGAVEVIW